MNQKSTQLNYQLLKKKHQGQKDNKNPKIPRIIALANKEILLTNLIDNPTSPTCHNKLKKIWVTC